MRNFKVCQKCKYLRAYFERMGQKKRKKFACLSDQEFEDRCHWGKHLYFGWSTRKSFVRMSVPDYCEFNMEQIVLSQ